MAHRALSRSFIHWSGGSNVNALLMPTLKMLLQRQAEDRNGRYYFGSSSKDNKKLLLKKLQISKEHSSKDQCFVNVSNPLQNKKFVSEADKPATAISCETSPGPRGEGI